MKSDSDMPTTKGESSELNGILDEIEARAEKATPGPWTHRTAKIDPVGFVEAKNLRTPHAYGQEILGDDYFPELSKADDAAFIAASRTDVPLLVKALRRAVEQLSWALAGDPGLLENRKFEIASILKGKTP